jgi:hypothetical protein
MHAVLHWKLGGNLMAKKKSRWGKAAAVGAGLPAGVIAGEIIGNALGQVLADGVEYLGKRKGKGKRKWLAARSDAAETLLRTLRVGGGQDVADLVRTTGIPLGLIMRAVTDAQTFGLVKVSTADAMVELTDVGTRTTVALESSTRDEVGKVIES